jgi:hypothetical protein
MPIRKRVLRVIIAHLVLNDLGDERPALLGNGREPWYRLAIPTVGKRRIAYDVNVRKVSNRKIWLNLDPACGIGFGFEPSCSRA